MSVVQEAGRYYDAAKRARWPAELGYAPVLSFWVVLTVLLHGALWASGLRQAALAEAVETGVAVVEGKQAGEVAEDITRKAIQTQRETLPFWTTMALVGDFVADPLTLVARAALTAALFSAAAALTGNPVKHAEVFTLCAVAQGVWVLGLAVRVGLALALGDPEADTSLALALPAGTYTALEFMAARQFNPFALLGWAVTGRAARERGHVNAPCAVAVAALLFALEAAARLACGVTAESGMRLMLIPEWVRK